MSKTLKGTYLWNETLTNPIPPPDPTCYSVISRSDGTYDRTSGIIDPSIYTDWEYLDGVTTIQGDQVIRAKYIYPTVVNKLICIVYDDATETSIYHAVTIGKVNGDTAYYRDSVTYDPETLSNIQSYGDGPTRALTQMYGDQVFTADYTAVRYEYFTFVANHDFYESDPMIVNFDSGVVKTNYGLNTVYGIGCCATSTGDATWRTRMYYSCDFKYTHSSWSNLYSPSLEGNLVEVSTVSSHGYGSFRNITFGNGDSGVEVPDDFYEWFIKNTMRLDDGMELSGTWEFSERVNGVFIEKELDTTDGQGHWFTGECYPKLVTEIPFFNEDISAVVNTTGVEVQAIRVVPDEPALGSGDYSSFSNNTYQHFKISYIGRDIGGKGIDSIPIYDPGVGSGTLESQHLRWIVKGCRTITFNPGTKVSAHFYAWFVSNATSVELCEISGRWKWNSVPAMHTRDFDKVKVNFTSAFSNMDHMLIESDDMTETSEITYIAPYSERKVYTPYFIPLTGGTKLTGTWRFNDEISDVYLFYHGDLEATFETAKMIFTRDGRTVDISKIVMERGATRDDEGNDILVTDLKVYFPSGGTEWIWSSVHGWMTNKDSFVISFGTRGETVSDEFYEWFTASATSIVDDLALGWSDNIYDRVMDFGTGVQKVAKEFYDWFTANATEQKLVELRGRWQFMTGLSDVGIEVPGIAETVSFKTVTNDRAYRGIMLAKSNSDSLTLRYCTYISPGNVIEYHDVALCGGIMTIWPNGLTDRTIDFGSTSQFVSEQFYNWLEKYAISHAYLIQGTVMFKETLSLYTDFSGINLHTEHRALFTSKGQTYERFVVEKNNENLRVIYGDTIVYENGAWVDDEYRLIIPRNTSIDLHPNNYSNYFYLSEKQYEWFMANLADEDYILVKRTTLIGIADAIRGKTGGVDKIMISDLREEVVGIKQEITLGNIVSVSIRET